MYLHVPIVTVLDALNQTIVKFVSQNLIISTENVQKFPHVKIKTVKLVKTHLSVTFVNKDSDK